jgi:hypothetical protein
MSDCTEVRPRHHTLDFVFYLALIVSSAYCFTCQRPVEVFDEFTPQVFKA